MLLILNVLSVYGQENTKTAQDSAAMYKRIQSYSEKRRFTKFVHGLIFEPLTPKKLQKKKQEDAIRFSAFQGKIIRKINITTLDPFGFSERDSTRFPQKPLSKFGNRMHLKTKQLTIWNLILLRRKQPLDSLLVKESERLIRAQRFVRRVIIRPIPTPYKDSVDIDIRELDSWSLVPDAALSGTKASYELTERNFLGIGHQVYQRYQQDFGEGRSAYSVNYTVPNILNTYIRTDIKYNIDLYGQYRKSIGVERPFFSPYARWGAGAYIDQWFRRDSVPDTQGLREYQSFKSNASDFWAGHSIQLFKGDSESERTTNLITSARYYNLNYIDRPLPQYDQARFYTDEKNYLIGLGISSRQFIQDHYLFNYGIIEDVPIGRVFGLVGGLQYKNQGQQTYAGLKMSEGRYTNIGYLAYDVEVGSFFRDGISNRSALVVQADYFTPLLETGKWKFRQFLKGRMVVGNRRQDSWGDELTLLGEDGIPGFRSTGFYGTKKWLVTTQTQSFSPWDLLGFRLNPFFRYSIGMLGDAEHGFSKSKAYSQIGVGLIISNDYLVFSSFQLSFAYYPSLPEQAGMYSTNAFSTEDFGLMSFEFAKPEFVDYK
ncbi:BamA/TamA family outer membrane protein [Flavobacterium silvaticum]|uniref:Haemolysin activator HlyB C-terminal domain-containing protein n=1 Tax=Flavobacterium silvaticum TaxID=1852020 RepID=A0A972JJ28_9FLAO|nr:hypothetical protein [Flavobacterium silvaticum]NMH28918.1 hypothetical protein [Flavobacterium silvaticum]